jgi:radical SAM superfamily enzyme YgiQ (UPF0313 family)
MKEKEKINSPAILHYTRDPKILLMYPPLQFLPEDTAKPEGSLGLLYLAGTLRQYGYKVDLLDTCVGNDNYTLEETFFRKEKLSNGLIRIGMSFDQIAKDIVPYDVVGITSLFTQQTSRVIEIVKSIKKIYPSKMVILGGVNARHLFSKFLEVGADIVCLSEAEHTILDIGDTLRRGSRDFSEIQGIAFKKDGRTVINPMRVVEQDLDRLTFPAWDMLPLKKYWELARPHGGGFKPEDNISYASLMTSRGCPLKCEYCHNSKEGGDSYTGNIRRVRFKSLGRVLQEFDILQALGVKYFFIEDDALLANKKRAMSIFKELKKRKLILSDVNGVNISHMCKRVGDKLTIDEELLETMAEAGFVELTLPFESGSQRILDKYASKKLDLQRTDTISVIHAAKKLRLTVGGNFIIGYPDETYDEMTATIMLAKRHMDEGMDRANLMCVVPFPGTKLFDMAVAGGYIDPDIDPDKFNWLYPTMKNTTIHPEVLKYVNKICWKLLNKSWRINNITSMSIGASSDTTDK